MQQILLALLLAAAAANARIAPFRPQPEQKFAAVPKRNIDSVREPEKAALDFAATLTKSPFAVKNVVKTRHNGMTHVYLKQLHKGKEISNADMNINVDSRGQVVSYGSSFATNLKELPQLMASSTVTPVEAFKVLAKKVGFPEAKEIKEKSTGIESGEGKVELVGIPYAEENVKVERGYVQTKEGLIPTWRMVVRTKEDWLNAHIKADGEKVMSVNNWFADAAYEVLPLGEKDIETSKREVVENPEDKEASPKGWHLPKKDSFTEDGTEGVTTTGNNVFAQENWTGGKEYLNNKRPYSKTGEFKYTVDLTKDPKDYYDASVTNLFYWNNIMHDVYYKYGFDEAAGNFQKENFEKGGKGNDFVVANAQDGSGFNNAKFGTPPDGENPRMLMYVFNKIKPRRDGAFVSDIIIHEYTHGISNRLTGGPSNADCLMDFESGSMGEGWGDFLAVMNLAKKEDTSDKSIGVGQYVNKGKTIRAYDYSTDLKVNPLTYKSLNEEDNQEVHSGGTIWANTLFELYWALREATGKFSEDIYSADKTAGNTLAIQLVIDGMKLQPCNPTFLQARDAILQAEKAATDGKYKCAVWKAFSKRGMGPKAESKTTDDAVKVTADFDLPEECGGSAPTDPKEPKEPKEPKDPKDPVDPKDPTDPKEPKDPKEPVDPKEPKEPKEPVDPKEPKEPPTEPPKTPEKPKKKGPPRKWPPTDPTDPQLPPPEKPKKKDPPRKWPPQ